MAKTHGAIEPPMDAHMRPLHLVILLVFTAFVALAGTFSLSPLDRDEARFIQATTQMLETNDFINIRFQEQERNKKPVGIYWLQAASVSLFSDTDSRLVWPYRVPSFIAALLSVMLLYWGGCRLFDEKTALLAALLLAATPSFAVEATIAKTDAVLLTTIIAAQILLAHIYLQVFVAREKVKLSLVILFWIALGIGVLIKGPIAPMVSFLTICVLIMWQFISGSADKRFTPFQWLRAVKPFTGLLIIALIISPWMIAIGITTQGRFFEEALGTDMLGKVSQQQESHGGPFGYHFIAMWLMFWPGLLLLPIAIRVAFARLNHPGVIFCLAWLLPSWIVFELASTKLPHYTLPLYPALALLVGYMVTSLTKAGEISSGFRVERIIGTAVYLLVAVLLCALFLYAPVEFGHGSPSPLHYGFAAITLIWSLYNIVQLWRAQLTRVFYSSCLLGAVAIWFVIEGMLARLPAFQISPTISAILEEHDKHPIRNKTDPVAMLGYNEPSIVFLLGTQTNLTDVTGAVGWLSGTKNRVVIVEDRHAEEFHNTLKQTQPMIKYRQLGVVTGHNYSKGKDLILTLYVSE